MRLPLVSYSYTGHGGNACNSWLGNTQCNRDLILITNCSNIALPAAADTPTKGCCSCYDWGDNVERSGAAALLRRHPGPSPKHPNGKHFEMSSIVRWLFLAQLATDLQLSAVVFLDCDVAVYSDFAALYHSHSVLPLADVASMGYNGAVSVWRRPALDSFAAFLTTLVATCDTAVLSRRWCVDMKIIHAWQRMQTDMHLPIGQDGPRGSFPVANVTTYPLQQPPFRTIDLRKLRSSDPGGWPLQHRWPVPRAWRFAAGDVGIPCAPKSPKGGGCPAQPAPNCSDNQRPFKALMAPAPHPTKGPQLLTQLYMVPHQTDAEPTGALCTPFVSDGCGTHLPFHIVHFTGRFKHYMGIAKRMQQRCTCIRSWKNEWLEGTPGGAVLFSHNTLSSRTINKRST